MKAAIRTAWLGLVALLVVGCAGSAGTAAATADQGYVAADGSIVTTPVADRSVAPRIAGNGLDGRPVDSAAYAGQVLVYNVWASWCPPCIAEAPALQAAATDLAPQGVQFLGINIGDNAAAARAHERRFGVTYPSVSDPNSEQLLAFRGAAPMGAPPVTVIVDRAGRVAAVASGAVSGTTVRGLVDDVVDETAAGKDVAAEPTA
jgi:thiol-disulfide isomerase/thioredoxin